MNKGYQNFKKRAGQLAIALTLAGTTAIGANAATVTGVTKANVNMRSGAGTKYKVVKVVKANKTVTILGQKGSWYKVKYNGKTGYISKSYVIKKNYTVKKYSGKYKTKVALTVRKGPGTNYVKAGTLKKGEVVTVKGKTSNGWLQITYKGATRYISGSSKYVVKYTAPVKNNAPVINVEDTYTLTKGEDFEYAMLNATATDKEDGDLTSKIQISGDKVDTTRLGTYNVVATVTDSKGIPERLTITVNVVENMEPQITIGNKTMVIEQGDAINRQSILEALKVKAINPEDNSDITNKVDIYGLGSVNVNTPGDYTIKLSVEDEIGGVTGSALEQATIKVVANQKPVINVQSKFIIMQGSNFKPSADIKATATDTNLATGEVRDISSSIKYEGAEYVNTNVPGPYTITVKATDNKGLVTTERIVVVVKAYSEPTITINNKDVVNGVLTVKSGTTVNEDTFAAVAKDYRGDSLDITYDGLDKVNTKRVGTYKVTLTARDEFGRPATATVYVDVVE